MMVNQKLRGNCVNRAGVRDKDSTHGRVSVNPEHCQTVIKQSGNRKHDLFRLGSRNTGILRGRIGEIVENSNRRKIGICWVQELRWRGASTRTITGKNSQCKLLKLGIGNENGNGDIRIFVAKK